MEERNGRGDGGVGGCFSNQTETVFTGNLLIEAFAQSTAAEQKTSGLICLLNRVHGDVEVFQLRRGFTTRGQNR